MGNGCGRCGGSGIFYWGAVINGVPSHSGPCFACVGGGMYAPRRRTQRRCPDCGRGASADHQECPSMYRKGGQ